MGTEKFAVVDLFSGVGGKSFRTCPLVMSLRSPGTSIQPTDLLSAALAA